MRNLLPIVVVVLSLVTAATIWNLAGALGRVIVLTEQVEVLEDSTEVLNRFVVEAQGRTDSLLAMIPLMEAEAAVAVAEVQAELSIQEAEAEGAFRRAEALAANNPGLERAIQEMDAEFRVQGMIADSVIAESAAQLLIAQNQIRSMEFATIEERNTRDEEDRVRDAREALKDQIIAEQQRAIAPSFLRNLFQNTQLVMVTAAASAAVTYVATR